MLNHGRHTRTYGALTLACDLVLPAKSYEFNRWPGRKSRFTDNTCPFARNFVQQASQRPDYFLFADLNEAARAADACA